MLTKTFALIFYTLIAHISGSHVTKKEEWNVPQVACSSRLDIVFLIDSSGSVQKQWNDTINHAEDLANQFHVSDADTRVGIVEYSSIANVYKHLDNENTDKETRAMFEELRRRPQNSRSAFERGVGWSLELFKASKRRPSTMKKVLIVYTDAQWTPVQTTMLKQYIQVLNFKEIEVFFLLMGDLTEGNVLSTMTDQVKIFNVKTTLMEDLTKAICKESFDTFNNHVSHYKYNETFKQDTDKEVLSYPKEIVNTDSLDKEFNISDNRASNWNQSTNLDDIPRNDNHVAKTKPGKSLATLPAMILYNAVPKYNDGEVKYNTTQSFYNGNFLSSTNIEEITEKGSSLYAHNFVRSLHGSPPLEWDENLRADAQKQAYELAERGGGMESPGVGPGENRYMSYGWKSHIYDAVFEWYKGVREYNYSNPRFAFGSGTFTQLVWKSSEKLGVGMAYNKDAKKMYVVALYTPPGNFADRFASEVNKPLAGCE